MADMSLDEVMAGATLRAAICKRCGTVCAVAIDEMKAFKNVRVRHPRGSKGKAFSHEVWRGKDRLMHWFITDDGRMQSCGMVDGMLIRISEMPPEDAKLGDLRSNDGGQNG